MIRWLAELVVVHRVAVSMVGSYAMPPVRSTHGTDANFATKAKLLIRTDIQCWRYTNWPPTDTSLCPNWLQYVVPGNKEPKLNSIKEAFCGKQTHLRQTLFTQFIIGTSSGPSLGRADNKAEYDNWQPFWSPGSTKNGVKRLNLLSYTRLKRSKLFLARIYPQPPRRVLCPPTTLKLNVLFLSPPSIHEAHIAQNTQLYSRAYCYAAYYCGTAGGAL